MNKDLKSYFDLRELVKDCGGIENFRFFGHLNKPAGVSWKMTILMVIFTRLSMATK